MILIDFLDNNVKDTLILTRSLRPDSVVLIADENDSDNMRVGMPAIIQSIGLERGTRIRTEVINLDSRDIQAILEKVKSAVKSADAPSEEVLINLSCENDLMTACAYTLCTETAADSHIIATPVCVDIRAGVVRNVRTFEEICRIEHLQIDDYLTAIGAKELESSRDMPSPEEYDNICMICEELFKNVKAWNHLCVYISNHYSQQHDRITIPSDLGGSSEGKAHQKTISRQLAAFCDGGILENLEDDKYRFTSTRHRGWMTVFGVWLEMYIYIKLKPYVDEIRLGLVLDWDAGDGFDTKDNELDVVAIRQSRPIVISCKMRMPNKEDIYEVGYICDRIAGRAGKAAIATSEIVDHKESYKPGLFPRFRKMDIELIETIDISRSEDSAREVFNKLF